MAHRIRTTAALLALLLLAGCGGSLPAAATGLPLGGRSSAASDPAPEPLVLENSAPGTLTRVSADGSAALDYSNTADGYIMVAISAPGGARHVLRLTGPDGAEYKYYSVATDGTYLAYPLSGGSGAYTLAVFRNLSGTSYASVASFSFEAQVRDDTAAFLRPNYFVDYDADTLCVRAGCEACAGAEDELEQIAAVFALVTKTLDYDYDKAAAVKTGYRPELDAAWTAGKGICFDYASALCAMLRALGIPARLVIGYAGEEYHAWISAYTKERGWVESIIYFDGTVWTYMDPTFVSVRGRLAAKALDASYYNGLFIY